MSRASAGLCRTDRARSATRRGRSRHRAGRRSSDRACRFPRSSGADDRAAAHRPSARSAAAWCAARPPPEKRSATAPCRAASRDARRDDRRRSPRGRTARRSPAAPRSSPPAAKGCDRDGRRCRIPWRYATQNVIELATTERSSILFCRCWFFWNSDYWGGGRLGRLLRNSCTKPIPIPPLR